MRPLGVQSFTRTTGLRSTRACTSRSNAASCVRLPRDDAVVEVRLDDAASEHLRQPARVAHGLALAGAAQTIVAASATSSIAMRPESANCTKSRLPDGAALREGATDGDTRERAPAVRLDALRRRPARAAWARVPCGWLGRGRSGNDGISSVDASAVVRSSGVPWCAIPQRLARRGACTSRSAS